MTYDVAAEGRLTVSLMGVPTALYRRAQQHIDDLLRELVLMAGHAGVRLDVARLAKTAREHHAARMDQREQGAALVAEAEERGAETVTLTYALDLAGVRSAEVWAAVLTELDGLCRSGAMLSVPASGEVAAFLRWHCAEIVGQVRDGAEPCPWPIYALAARAPR
jgi:hypothetical protein